MNKISNQVTSMYIRENAIDYLIYIFFFVRLSAVLVCFVFSLHRSIFL